MSNFRTYGVALLATVTFLFSSAAVALTVDDLVGTWNMTYDMGQGAMSGTIVISMNDDGSPAISLNTSGGGSSQASDIVIEGEEINFSRSVSAQLCLFGHCAERRKPGAARYRHGRQSLRG